MLAQIVEGWTAELGPFTLTADGQAVDLTNCTVAVHIRRKLSATYLDTAGSIRVDNDPTTGRVYWTPGAEDFPVGSNGNYDFRFQVTLNGTDLFFPNKQAETVRVNKR